MDRHALTARLLRAAPVLADCDAAAAAQTPLTGFRERLRVLGSDRGRCAGIAAQLVAAPEGRRDAANSRVCPPAALAAAGGARPASGAAHARRQSRSDDGMERARAAMSLDAPRAVWLRLLNDPAREVAVAVAANPACPLGLLYHIMRSRETGVAKTAVCNRVWTGEQIDQMTRHRRRAVVEQAAADGRCPPETLQRLASHPDRAVVEAVARNARCPQETIRRIIKDAQRDTVSGHEIVSSALSNTSCPTDMFAVAAKHDEFTHDEIAANPRCPPEVLDMIGRRGSKQTRLTRGSKQTRLTLAETRLCRPQLLARSVPGLGAGRRLGRRLRFGRQHALLSRGARTASRARLRGSAKPGARDPRQAVTPDGSPPLSAAAHASPAVRARSELAALRAARSAWWPVETVASAAGRSSSSTESSLARLRPVGRCGEMARQAMLAHAHTEVAVAGWNTPWSPAARLYAPLPRAPHALVGQG